jgi:CubicO group peptidase (beta-lactamase class C family)
MKQISSILLVLLLCISIAFGQKRTKVDHQQLDRYFNQMVKDWDIPSMSIGVVKDGQLVFTGSYGVLETGKTQKPDANTLYGIASNSKAFTSTLIAMLVEEGILKWNDKVKKYLPYFELYDPWVSNEITIRDLLSHRVGLGTFSGDVIWYKSDFTSEEIIKRAKYIPQSKGFRTEYGYSNLMYITAGEIIKTVTGKSWAENVNERILIPLGMNRTVSTPKDINALGNFSTPHARENNINIPIEWEDWEEIAATGGLISSVNDLSKWMIFNLNYGVHNNTALISKQNLNLIWTPHINFTVDHTTKNDFNQHFRGYGLGWSLSDYKGRLRVGHTGAIDGMLTAVTLIPDEKMGVVVLTNGMKSPMMAATFYAIDMFLGEKTKDWSADLLERTNKSAQEDRRIANIKNSRVLNTNPTLPLEKYAGNYLSDIHGKIFVTHENNELRMTFERSTYLSAKLAHWHFDVFEIVWDNKHAWFNFGTVKFNTNNNLEIIGMDFEVPNDDIFFEELKPYRVK